MTRLGLGCEPGPEGPPVESEMDAFWSVRRRRRWVLFLFSGYVPAVGTGFLIHEYVGIVIVHPNWWGQPPAILKGWIDRVTHRETFSVVVTSSPEQRERWLGCVRGAVARYFPPGSPHSPQGGREDAR